MSATEKYQVICSRTSLGDHPEERLLILRRASEADCRLIWEWNNDPEVRAASFSTEPIAWETHETWYSVKCRDPNCFFYVATNMAGDPIGQIRYDVAEYDAIVSVAVAKQMRGKGYGFALITQGGKLFFAESIVNFVHAYIRTNNRISLGAFEKAGFIDLGTVICAHQQSQHLVLRR